MATDSEEDPDVTPIHHTIVVDGQAVARFVERLSNETAGLTTFVDVLARVLEIDPAAYYLDEIWQVSTKCARCELKQRHHEHR